MKIAIVAAVLAMITGFAVLGSAIVILLNENDDLRAENLEQDKKLDELQDAISNLGMKITEQQQKIAVKDSQIQDLNSTLQEKNSKIRDLEEDLSESEEKLAQAESSLVLTEEKIEEIREDARALEERINSSIQWFNDNSRLPDLYQADRFKSIVERRCTDGKKLNLACVSFMMEEELGITYKSDFDDRLYSNEEIIERKGGDCEDYSLFFTALMNSLKEKGYELVAFDDGSGIFDVYQDNSQVWYYENADAVEIGKLDELNVYPVCYYYDRSGSLLLGHCVVMFTKNRIENEIVGDFNGSKLVEPQDGKYVGSIGKEFSMCYDDCEFYYSIKFIITENDLFQYDLEWDNYHKYRQRLKDLSEWPEIPS